MNLILCGMPMCGKSHFGKNAAARLNASFIDTDLLIEEFFQLSCREVVLKHGEAVFRQKEREILSGLDVARAVIATGGGALMDGENSAILKTKGILVYLKTPSEVLLHRLKNKENVPAYLDPREPELSFLKLMERRTELYEKFADVVLETRDQSEEEIISAICRLGEKNGQQ